MRWTNRTFRAAALWALLAVPGCAVALAWAADPAQFKGVKVDEAASGVTIVLQTSASMPYQAVLIESPPRLVIDLSGNYAATRMRWSSTPEPIKEIRGSQWKPGTARVVVELTHPTGYRIEEGPAGLSVVLTSGAVDAKAPAAKPDAPADAAKAASSADKAKTAPLAPVAKVDAPKPEPAKAFPPVVKIDPPRVDTPKAELAKATPPVPDVAKAEAAKPTAPPIARADLAKVDAVKAEPVKAEPAKSGPIAIDAAKPLAKPMTLAELKPAPEPKLDAPKRDVQSVGAAAARPESLAALAGPIRIAQATAPPTGTVQPSTNGSKLITLDFKDADVINVLRILGAEGGRNIVAGDDVKGKVSVSLKNVTWDQALETILEARSLQKVEKGSVIRIVSNEQLAKEREALARAEEAKRKAEIEVRTKMAEAQLKETELAAKRAAAEAMMAEAQARGPLREEVVRLSYADPIEVAKTLQGILGIPPDGTVAGPNEPPGVIPSNGLSGPPLIAEPPFSALYGVGLQQRQPLPVVSVSQDVLAKGITIRANKATNSIFLRLYQRDLEQIKKLITEYFDVPLPQVKIEARMEILDRTALEAIGIQWGGGGATNAGKTTLVGQGFGQPNLGGGTAPFNFTPVNQNLGLSSILPISPVTGLPAGGNLVNLPLGAFANAATAVPTAGLAFGIVGTNFNINLALQALNEMGKTRTLARPEIVTVENNKAAISLGEEIPYATVSSAGTQIQFKEALLKLEVTPTVIRTKVNGLDTTKIKMVVIVENNDRGEVVNLGTSGAPPAINRRKAETLVLMNEGERLVIGGVSTARNQETVRKVPGAGDIPVLGWLFKARENFEQGRELVVFLTPSVLRAMVAGPAPTK